MWIKLTWPVWFFYFYFFTCQMTAEKRWRCVRFTSGRGSRNLVRQHRCCGSRARSKRLTMLNCSWHNGKRAPVRCWRVLNARWRLGNFMESKKIFFFCIKCNIFISFWIKMKTKNATSGEVYTLVFMIMTHPSTPTWLKWHLFFIVSPRKTNSETNQSSNASYSLAWLSARGAS